jgi:hypothetical protein
MPVLLARAGEREMTKGNSFLDKVDELADRLVLDGKGKRIARPKPIETHVQRLNPRLWPESAREEIERIQKGEIE